MSSEFGGRLQITSDKISGQGARFVLAGADITNMLQSVTVQWQEGGVVTATLTILPDSVEIDAVTLAHLTALVKDE